VKYQKKIIQLLKKICNCSELLSLIPEELFKRNYRAKITACRRKVGINIILFKLLT